MKARYDVVIFGAGHNGLVAAAYLAHAGLSVLMLEKNDYVGGATTSQQVFPDYEASLSRYSYLVSLFPQKIIDDLGLSIKLLRRKTASYTPYIRGGRQGGLLLSNVSEDTSRSSMKNLTGNDSEFDGMKRFYRLPAIFANEVWETMLEPLRARADFQRRFAESELGQETWRSLVEEPLGRAIERYLQDDLVRGLVFTDAKIGVFTHPHDESLIQNRCFLYHLIGNNTGEWKVPAGGMGRLASELEAAARQQGTEIRTNVHLQHLECSSAKKTISFTLDGQPATVEARFLLINFGLNVLASLTGNTYQPDATNEGSVFKINMLLHRLPQLKDQGTDPADAFGGTFHVDEGYEAMKQSYQEAVKGRLPDKVPGEIYCHTLTDDSILSPDLRTNGYQTLTLFGLDTPWSLFQQDNEAQREKAQTSFIAGLNRWLAEPLEDCLARAKDGTLCIESKSPVDIEDSLGLYRGNIFQNALTFPFAETEEEIGSWGVETSYDNVYLCGASAARGGAVSGIPGHNAAMKVLKQLKTS